MKRTRGILYNTIGQFGGNDETLSLHNNLKTEFETHKQDGDKKLKNHFINHSKSVSEGKVKFAEGTSDLAKAGFKQHISDTY